VFPIASQTTAEQSFVCTTSVETVLWILTNNVTKELAETNPLEALSFPTAVDQTAHFQGAEMVLLTHNMENTVSLQIQLAVLPIVQEYQFVAMEFLIQANSVTPAASTLELVMLTVLFTVVMESLIRWRSVIMETLQSMETATPDQILVEMIA